MGYESPKYSKNKVNCAGNFLAGKKSKGVTNLDTMDVLSNWRLVHAYPLNKFYNSLKAKLKSIDSSALAGQRLKRAPSIIEKLKRYNTMKLSQMQDIGGVRAVVVNIAKIRKLEKAYRSPRFNHELVHWNDYINTPKTDGYRGLHLIFKYRSVKADDYNNLLIEVQLRTQIQHAWATAVETMDIYLGQALKLGRGDRKWKKFFKYTSMAFSILESSNPVPGFGSLTEKKVFEQVRMMNKELNVLEKLRAFSIATDTILNEKGVGVYSLVKLDIDERTLNISRYTKNRLNEASDELTRLEKQHAGNGNIDVVLLSAGPLKKLKKSYPNYFFDTASFIKKVERVIELSKASQRTLSFESFYRKSKPKRTSTRKDVVRNLLFSGDIPQADKLDSVRDIVDVVNKGIITHKEICVATNYSSRHVQYKVASAVILGFLDKLEDIKVTPKGKEWLQKKQGSSDESKFLQKSIEETKVYNLIAQDMFTSKRPDREVLTKRIMDFANLSESTARRRAGTLIAWSHRIMSDREQLDIWSQSKN